MTASVETAFIPQAGKVGIPVLKALRILTQVQIQKAEPRRIENVAAVDRKKFRMPCRIFAPGNLFADFTRLGFYRKQRVQPDAE